MNKTYWFIICLAALFICSPELRAAEDSSPAKLMGTLNWDGQRMAFIKLKRWPSSVFLRVGERHDDVELLAADEQTAKVKLSKAGEAILLAFDSKEPVGEEIKQVGDKPADKPLTNQISFRLQGMETGDILKIYQKVAKRTLLRGVLRRYNDPIFHFDLYSKGQVSAEALLKSIEAGMAKHGVALQPHRERFAVAGTPQDIFKLTPEVWSNSVMLAESHDSTHVASQEQVLHPGALRLENAEVGSVLQLLSEFCDRTPLYIDLSYAGITFNSEIPLSMTEVIYAFNAMLALHDLSTQPMGDKFVFIYPTRQSNQMAYLMAQKWLDHFPESKEEASASTNSVAPPSKPALQPITIKLTNAPLAQVLSLYGTIAGQKIECPTNFPARVTLKSQAPLTRSEALHALDLLLGWQELRMIQEREGVLSLVRDARKEKKKTPKKAPELMR